eukprot:scaffold194496_cov31-Tisochrysis_lutea.AAC.2
MARACDPPSGPQEACRGLGAQLRGQVRLGLGPGPSPSCLSLADPPRTRKRSTGADWGLLIRGVQVEEGLIRQRDGPASVGQDARSMPSSQGAESGLMR